MLLVRKCTDNVVVSRLYIMSSQLYGYNAMVSNLPRFREIKRMRKQWIPGSLFPTHQEPGYKAKLAVITVQHSAVKMTPNGCKHLQAH